MIRKLALALALLAGLVLVVVAVATGSPNRKVSCIGNICIADAGGISPKKLPRRGMAPVVARLMGEISTRDGSHPPAFQTIDLRIDRTIELDARGLPVCKQRQLEARSTAEARRACGDAIIGQGFAEAAVAFPDQAPFEARGPLILFNGGVKGNKTVLLVHVYANVPVPTAIVTRVKITRIKKGRFGMRIQLRIPRISGGYGSVTEFDLKVGRRFTHKGRRKSLLMAGCPTGRWLAMGRASFVDGTRVAITHPFRCTPIG